MSSFPYIEFVTRLFTNKAVAGAPVEVQFRVKRGYELLEIVTDGIAVWMDDTIQRAQTASAYMASSSLEF